MSKSYPNLSPMLEVKDSSIQGMGVFTKVSVKRGDTIIINIDANQQHYESEVYNDAEFEEFKSECLRNGVEWDSVALGNGRHRAAIASRAEHPENYVNHSCDPNTDLEHVALRDIEAGGELTVDYSLISDDNWDMQCNCGSENCRGIVKGKVE